MTVKTVKKRHKKTHWLNNFDPDNEKSRSDGIFGLPCNYEEAQLVLIPVPWDVSSEENIYSSAPEHILQLSRKISLFSEDNEGFWKKGIFCQNVPQKWKETSEEFLKTKRKIFRHFYHNGNRTTELIQEIKRINFTCRLLNEWIETKTENILADNKICGLIGGDSGYLNGFISSLSKKYPHFGILNIDAVTGFEKHYYGLEFTHFSSMYGLPEFDQVSKLVLFGPRRLTYQSMDYIRQYQRKIRLHSFQSLEEKKMKGMTWKMLINEALSALPENIFLNFNYQSLTLPVSPDGYYLEPGGLTLSEIKSFLVELRNNAKKLIGFSYGGVHADNFTAAALLFDLCQTAIVSNS